MYSLWLAEWIQYPVSSTVGGEIYITQKLLLFTVFTRGLGINHWLGVFSAFLKNYLPTSSQALSKFNEYVRSNAAENYKYYFETLLDICNNLEISSISKQVWKRGCKQNKFASWNNPLCEFHILSALIFFHLFLLLTREVQRKFSVQRLPSVWLSLSRFLDGCLKGNN